MNRRRERERGKQRKKERKKEKRGMERNLHIYARELARMSVPQSARQWSNLKGVAAGTPKPRLTKKRLNFWEVPRPAGPLKFKGPRGGQPGRTPQI